MPHQIQPNKNLHSVSKKAQEIKRNCFHLNAIAQFSVVGMKQAVVDAIEHSSTFSPEVAMKACLNMLHREFILEENWKNQKAKQKLLFSPPSSPFDVLPSLSIEAKRRPLAPKKSCINGKALILFRNVFRRENWYNRLLLRQLKKEDGSIYLMSLWFNFYLLSKIHTSDNVWMGTKLKGTKSLFSFR